MYTPIVPDSKIKMPFLENWIYTFPFDNRISAVFPADWYWQFINPFNGFSLTMLVSTASQTFRKAHLPFRLRALRSTSKLVKDFHCCADVLSECFSVSFVWMPSHQDISGNCKADELVGPLLRKHSPTELNWPLGKYYFEMPTG